MLPKRSSSQFKSSSIISGFERARLSPSHFPTLLEEQLLIYKRPGSVESLESFDPINSVSDHVMSGAEAASKAEAVEESKFFDREGARKKVFACKLILRSVELLKSFDRVDSVSDLVMSGAEAAQFFWFY